MQRRIATQRDLMNQPETSAPQRLAALEAILRLREEGLINRPASDPRLPAWLADQASDLYFELLPTDATGLTALFGLPSSAQRQRARHVAEQMNELTARAEIAVEQAILNLEADPAYGEDPALQQMRRNLDRDERRRRIPFLRGIAAFLHAEVNIKDVDQQSRLYRIAADLLEPLGRELEDPLAGRAQVHAGLALLRLGESEAGEALFRQAIANEATHPADIFTARMGGVLKQAVQRGPEAGLAELDSIEDLYAAPELIFYRLLITDHRFLLRREIARSAAPADRTALLAAAINTYVDLLDRETAIDREKMRTIVFARLRLATDSDSPLDSLPPIVTMARAEMLAQETETRGEAIDLYENLLNRAEIKDDQRVAVLDSLGRTLAADGRPREAIARFLDLARDHPLSRHAEQAVELAARVAADQHRNSPDDRAARQALDEILSIILGEYSNLASINRWRYLAGRLAIDDRRYDDAAAHFEQITPDSDRWLDGQFMLTSALRAAVRSETDAVERINRCESLLAIVVRVRQALEKGLAGAPEPPRVAALQYYLDYLRVFEAEALTELNRPDRAIETLAGIEQSAALEPAVLAAVLHARIEAHQRLGRDELARRELHRFAQTAPEQVPAVMKPMMADVRREVENLLEQGRDEEALSTARRDLLPLAELLHGWLDDHRTVTLQEAEELWRHAADAYRLGGRFVTALSIYDQLLGRRPDSREILLGRAECLFGLAGDRLAEAMTIYKRIAASGVGESETQHRAYWQSQLRMLQILDRAQRRTQQILPRIRRLRQQDPGLGGQGFRRRFQRLENKYA
ncbi:MAG: hypothetical protein JSV91_12805 [Phycisphaerales bacterium]|nr:MAG: hypothetical protein JSV91_12805 [Phycisphaerales bacterium]